MNTITTETTTATGEERNAKSGKRRMAREPGNSGAPDAAGTPDKPQAAAQPPGVPSKIATIIALLEREQGASLAEMVEATGWLPHTTRAALTGLRKKGKTLTKDKRDNVTCYRIVVAGR